RRTATAARYVPRTFRHPARVSFDRHARGAATRAREVAAVGSGMPSSVSPARKRSASARLCAPIRSTVSFSISVTPAIADLRYEPWSRQRRTKIRGNWGRRVLERCRRQFPLIL
ncbi:hypothetical protein, partial [Nocardia brasiliensis]